MKGQTIGEWMERRHGRWEEAWLARVETLSMSVATPENVHALAAAWEEYATMLRESMPMPVHTSPPKIRRHRKCHADA